MRHLVITIGCEYGAKGNAIGRKIAEDLNIKFYNRELVDEIIEEVGIPKEIMEKVEEGGTIAGKGAEGDVRGSFSKYADLTDRAIHVQKQIIRKLAEKESCVIIGRSADYILKDSDKINLLRAFIYAPDDVRIHNIMESHNLTEKDARILLLEKDKRYHKRHLALTGSNRGDRHNRNILIDSSYLGIEGTADYIEELVRRKFGSGELPLISFYRVLNHRRAIGQLPTHLQNLPPAASFRCMATKNPSCEPTLQEGSFIIYFVSVSF